jgi:adenosine deaminase
MDGPAEVSHAIAALKKGELHVHLNGLVSANLVRTILIEEGAEIPSGFDLRHDLVRLVPCASLSSYLKPWQVLRRLPATRANLTRMCDDAFHTLSVSNVGFVEVRSSVLYLAGLQGCPAPEALSRMIEATAQSSAKYGITRGIILTVTRGDYSAAHFDSLIQAYRDLGCPPDVVGLDLAGDEAIPFPEELPQLFRTAKEKYGLGITVHAGETGIAQNILSAVRLFSADRIGHGTAAGSCPSVMEELCERNVCVEVCPISNRLTGAVEESEKHPLREFVQRGVPFVLCSDNPGIHNAGLNDDYEAAIAEGVDFGSLQAQYATAVKHSFLSITA